MKVLVRTYCINLKKYLVLLLISIFIGGGVAGCNTLYQLSKRGVNAILLERAKITCGTTWHTAGMDNVKRAGGCQLNTTL